MHEGFSEARIEIHFDVHQPVEVVTLTLLLTLALQSLGRDYRRFLNEHMRADGAKVSDDDVKLYVTKVESGSILAKLARAATVMGSCWSINDLRTAPVASD